MCFFILLGAAASTTSHFSLRMFFFSTATCLPETKIKVNKCNREDIHANARCGALVCCLQCDIVMTLNATDRCTFVKNTPDCRNQDGFINYLHVAFCLMPPNIIAFTVTLCVRSLCVWLSSVQFCCDWWNRNVQCGVSKKEDSAVFSLGDLLEWNRRE